MNAPQLRLVAMEVTRTCRLACRHCRGDSRHMEYSDELSLNEIKSLLDNISSFSKPIIIITGGEPLTRPDVFDIASYSTSLGLRTVLATCGHMLDDDTVNKLLEAGIANVYHIDEGFEGELDEQHHRSSSGGWRYHDLPWEQC